MIGRFHKMHGLGNDFVVIDARAQPVEMSPARARGIADRRTGVGCDQVIVLEADTASDAFMRIWNPDGSEVEACGNASRAVGVLLGHAVLRTLGGMVTVEPASGGITVDMGAPKFRWDEIPIQYAMETSPLPVSWDELAFPVAVNVGNPHLVFFVDDLDDVALATLGPRIERDPLFPAGINVNVARLESANRIRLRTWERGAGATRACGSGACATAVAALQARHVTGAVEVVSAGGSLTVEWQDGGSVHMTGPATQVFSGECNWDAFGA